MNIRTMKSDARIRPDANACCGRTETAKAVVSSAKDCQSVLLYGGRQSGKTTLLKFIEADLFNDISVEDEFGESILGVYVDLLTLPVEAGPGDFFQQLMRLTVEVCSNAMPQLRGSLSSSSAIVRCTTLDDFQEGMSQLFVATTGRIRDVIFLLDESKRVLGRRFPRGFQDNLFTLLYGSNIEMSGRISMVFSGAQELHSLYEEDTSPIGTRAAVHCLKNLFEDDIIDVVRLVRTDLEHSVLERIAHQIYTRTGGHAGLSARFAERLAYKTVDDIGLGFEAISDEIVSGMMPLFGHWNRSFTIDAKDVLRMWTENRSLSLKQIADVLEDCGHSRFGADWVQQELQYVGVAIENDGELEKASAIYWEYRDRFGPERVEFSKNQDVWNLIEETELGLRDFIEKRFLITYQAHPAQK